MPNYNIPNVRIELSDPFIQDPEWKGWLKENSWWYHEYMDSLEVCRAFHGRISEQEYQDFKRLHDILLSIGGYETCFPAIEEDMTKILERGYYRKGTSKLMRGQPSQCHANACNLWEQNQDKDVVICTGYALSQDGMWRQHSWLLHRYQTKTQHREQVIETTVKRVAYFGFEMTREEAIEFCNCNY